MPTTTLLLTVLSHKTYQMYASRFPVVKLHCLSRSNLAQYKVYSGELLPATILRGRYVLPVESQCRSQRGQRLEVTFLLFQSRDLQFMNHGSRPRGYPDPKNFPKQRLEGVPMVGRTINTTSCRGTTCRGTTLHIVIAWCCESSTRGTTARSLNTSDRDAFVSYR